MRVIIEGILIAAFLFLLGIFITWLGSSFINMEWAIWPTHLADLQSETRLILFVWFVICVAVMFAHWGCEDAEDKKEEEE